MDFVCPICAKDLIDREFLRKLSQSNEDMPLKGNSLCLLCGLLKSHFLAPNLLGQRKSEVSRYGVFGGAGTRDLRSPLTPISDDSRLGEYWSDRIRD